MTEIGPRKTCETEDAADAEATLTPEMLVRKYASAVLGVCLAHVKSLHDGEDIMQDVFLKAFAKLGALRDHSRARTWLLQIARRTCIDYYRNRRPEHSSLKDVPAPPDPGNEDITRLHAAISKLPDKYRETISLYYLDGRKCANVARSVGISEAAVRHRLVRARLMLHDLLSEGTL